MKIVTTGGRAFRDRNMVHLAMSRLCDFHAGAIRTVIHGAAQGADTLVGEWAGSHGLFVITVPADWETYGRGAGYARNDYMLKHYRPDLVLAFPGMRGTQMMCEITRRAGVPLLYARRLAI